MKAEHCELTGVCLSEETLNRRRTARAVQLRRLLFAYLNAVPNH